MSVVQIAKESLPEFHAGHGSIGTSEDKISAVAFPVRKHLIIRADKNNTNTISIGTPGDSANGFKLNAGDETPPLYVDSTDKLSIVGGAAGQNFSWVAN